jgi:enoyl-CoA hydratase
MECVKPNPKKKGLRRMDSGKETGKGLVNYKRDDLVGIISLNRPEKRNAINYAVWNDLDVAIAKAEQDEEARAVLLRGEGKSFCVGLELGTDPELESFFASTPGVGQRVRYFKTIKDLMRIFTRLEHLSKPTIALIHGYCVGGGLELVLCCDFRLCSADAQFSLPETKRAIIADMGGLYRLPKVVGPGHAREIAFRGHLFDAERARAILLVNDVHPDRETLELKGLEIARQIAENAPLAVQGTKEVFLFNEGLGQSRYLEYNAARTCMTIPSEDLIEAVSAFTQKRKAAFKGS